MARILRLLVAAAFLASPARAGKLDLDLYGGPLPKFAPPRTSQVPPGDLWKPGDPRYARGESLGVQAVASGGTAALGMVGAVRTMGAIGKSGEATAMSAGFGAIAVMGLWRSWRLWRDRPPEEKPKK